MDNVGYLAALIFLELLIVSQNGCFGTISCFVCSSRNGSNVACEDPFNAGNSTYTERCRVPKRGHIGEFPAHFCIKLIGISYSTNEKMVVRRCVTETMDTQCGKFRFEEDLLRGCVLTCDLDGCNSSNTVSSSLGVLVLCTITGILIAATSSTLPRLSIIPSGNRRTLDRCNKETTFHQLQYDQHDGTIINLNSFNISMS